MKKSILFIAVFFGALATSEAQITFNQLDTAPIYGSCEGVSDNAQRCFTHNITKAILENVIYPKKAKEKGISGIVYVNFTIDEKGNIANPKVLRGAEKSLDTAALSAFKGLKSCNSPGIKDGKAVPVEYTIPIKFALN